MCASIIACNLAIGSGRPATASGVAILGACSRSGHVADAQVGEIPGFARQPPPTGVAEMSASGHRLRRRRRGRRCASPWDYLFYRAYRANGANRHFVCKDSGWRFWGLARLLRACRRHPGRLNTRLRTAATTSGEAEMYAFGHRLRRWRRCGRFAAPDGCRFLGASLELMGRM